MGGVVPYELLVEPVGAGDLAALLLAARQTEHRVSGLCHDHLVGIARETLRQISLDRVGVGAVLLLLGGVLLLGVEILKGRGYVGDRPYRLDDLGILRENRIVVGDRAEAVARGELLVGALELRRAHLGDLLGRDLGLDLRAVLLLGKGLDLLRKIARRRGPRAGLVVEKHGDREVERAFAVPPAARLVALAEHEALDALVVGFRLLRLGLRLVPQHLRLEVETFGKR